MLGGVNLSTKSTQEHVGFLSESWKSIGLLLKKIRDQQATNPTWGSAISSATFACEGLALLGKGTEAEGSIRFIRDCYRVENGRLEIDVSKLSTVSDFNQIRAKMEDEERDGTFPVYYGLETSNDIDLALLHANWASGLILCAESALCESGAERLAEVAVAVEARANPAGFFYPARVPWCTARVLMGLGMCGRTTTNSSVVSQASNWLLKTRQQGGAREGVLWKSGTDGWNSTVETTAMCILGLRSVGVPADHPTLVQAAEWLNNQKRKWTSRGHEIDGAIALEAHLQMGGQLQRVKNEVLELARWADTIALWRSATLTADKTHEQTCRAAQVGVFLIKVMWEDLRENLPSLLLAMTVPAESDLSLHPGGGASQVTSPHKFDVVLSYASENRLYVEQVAKNLKRAGVSVFYDKFERAGMWGKDLDSHLDEVYRKQGRFCVMFISEHYQKKVWTNHERRSAQARAFLQNREYILPIRFDDTVIPGVSPTVGYIDVREYSPTQLCKLILEKLRSS